MNGQGSLFDPSEFAPDHDDCIVWNGTGTPDGYGQRRVPGRGLVYVHRLAWEQAHGPIPAGLVVRHRCDNPPCFRADHLELGTHADNMRDSIVRGRRAWSDTHCSKGHVYAEEGFYVTAQGWRQCRACRRVRDNARTARRTAARRAAREAREAS